MKEDSTDEQYLVGRLREGSTSAFEALYNRSAPRLQGFAARFRLSRDEADEIVQETFIRVWRHRTDINPEASFNTYIITIAKHLIYNQIKRAEYRDTHLRQEAGKLKQLQGETPIHERELEQVIGKAIMELPDKCRLIVRKSRLEGYSNQEIADELNISKSTVENQLNKGLKRIRRFLHQSGYQASSITVLLIIKNISDGVGAELLWMV